MQTPNQSAIYTRAFTLAQDQPDQILLGHSQVTACPHTQTITITANPKILRAIRPLESELLPDWSVKKIAS
jgi:hypothetical protein